MLFPLYIIRRVHSFFVSLPRFCEKSFVHINHLRFLILHIDDNQNPFSLVADFEGDESSVFDVEMEATLPILPLRNMVLFPGVVMPVAVGRKSSLRLAKAADKIN